MPAGYIEPDRAKRLEKLAKAVAKAEEELELAVMEAVEAGIALRVVGKHTGMSGSRVRDIARMTRQRLDGKPVTSREQEAKPERRHKPPPAPRKPWPRFDQ